MVAEQQGVVGPLMATLARTCSSVPAARANAAQAGVANVEFVKGFIEDVPLANPHDGVPTFDLARYHHP